MIRATFGVVGHVDHGKTALVRALTGMEADRLPEELSRGISIALGFAHMRVGDIEIDLIDMPGHEAFVRTMIAGATGINAVLLVVAANERVKPQTEEHIAVAALLGIRDAVIAISKADRFPDTDTHAAALEATALVARAGLRAGEPLLTSAITGAGVKALAAALGTTAAAAEPAQERGFCWLPIDRSFSLAGHGTIVTGTLRHGILTARTELEMVPGGLSVRVRGLQTHGQPTERASPGARVAANLRGIDRATVSRGRALATPGVLPDATWLTVQLVLLDTVQRTIRTAEAVRLLFGTTDVEAKLRLLDRNSLAPGASCIAQLHCMEPVAVPVRERFVLRLSSPAVTIGGGFVIDRGAVRLRRHAPEILSRLDALAREDVPAMLARELAEAGAIGCTLADLIRLAGLGSTQVAELLRQVPAVVTEAGVAVAASTLDAVALSLRHALAADSSEQGAGKTLAELAPLLDLTPSIAVLEEAVTRLVAESVVRRDGAAIRLDSLPDHVAIDDTGELAETLAEALRSAGLEPPDPVTLRARDHRAGAALDRLLRAGILIRTVDRAQRRDLFFHRDAVRTAREILAPLLAASVGVLTKDAGAALGISRKYSIPLLEHLDATRFTRRVGDRRVLASPVAPDA